MFYFSNFPTTLYEVSPASYSKPAEYVALTDITRNVRFKKEIIDNIVLYDYYDIKENETIEIVSENIYGSPYYHWVLMLLNNKFDYVKDYPLSLAGLEEYIRLSYDADYLSATYGIPAEGLILDIMNEKDQSVDYKGNITIITASLVETIVPVMSVWYYDSTLKKNIKRFLRTDVPNTYIDTKVYTINYGDIPGIKIITAVDYENELNESKRRIKVISEELLQVVTTNFRELM